jgi:hypothetical protein
LASRATRDGRSAGRTRLDDAHGARRSGGAATSEELAMRRTLALGLALVLTAIGLASAQETTTGSIAGRVVDAQALATPGATVTVTGPQGSRTLITDDQGRFLTPFLTPGTYEVRIELQGFKPIERRNVVVRLGQRVELTDLKLEVGDLSQIVEVTAATPVVDARTTTVGGTLSDAFLRAVPVGRRFSDTLFIAPGVSSGGGTGNANPSLSGGSGLENEYIVDGVNISNTGFGALGSYSIVFGSLGNGLPFDFMKEVQVKTGGYEPEYGQSTGGIVNVITKSGSNNVRGTAFGFIRPSDLEADWTRITTINGTVNTTKTKLWDAGAEVGGPVLKNRLFFFGAIDPYSETRTFIAPEGFPLRALGEVDRDREILNYAAKGTWQINPSHRVDASFFGDPANGDMGPQRSLTSRPDILLGQDTSAFSEISEFGGHNQTVRYDGIIRPSWLIEASFARAQNDIIERPLANEWQITDTTVTPQVRRGGIGFFEQAQEGKNFQYQAKSTNLFNGLGTHQVRYGFVYEDISFDRTIQRTGPTFTLPNGERTVTGASISILPDPVWDRIFRVTRANTSNVADSNQDYFSIFAQDSWRVGKRVTIIGGLRWDRQKLEGTLDDFTWDENFAPRIGATVDPLGTGKMKVFGNWGRFYSKIPNDIAVRALSADAGVTRADYFDENLTRPVPEGVLAAGATRHFIQAGLEPSVFDPDLNGASLDEVVIGAEYEALPGLNLSVRYINRRINDIVEDIGTAPVAAFFVPGSDLSSVEFFVTNPSPATPVIPGFGASHEDPIHDYDAIEVHADKRFGDNWGLQASYRWARLEGTFEGFFRNDNNQSDPGITSLNDFPTNDPSFAQLAPMFGFRGDIRFLGEAGEGPLPNDRRHQVKVFGNYLFDFGLNVGAGFIGNSGAPLTALAAHPVFTNAGEIPEGPRGSGIQTVDGFKTRTETEYTLDFHADYGFRLPGGRCIVALLDVFNLLDADQTVAYDNFTELTFGDPNPDFGARRRIQDPLQIRIGARFEF